MVYFLIKVLLNQNGRVGTMEMEKLSPSLRGMGLLYLTHTNTHTHIHINTHMHTHRPTYIYSRAYTSIHIRAPRSFKNIIVSCGRGKLKAVKHIIYIFFLYWSLALIVIQNDMMLTRI